MKTLKTFLTASLVTMLFTVVQADNPISALTYENSSNMFSAATHQSSTPVGILSYGDDYNQNSVWSTEYEEYVDAADFEKSELVSIDNINQFMENNPTASGSIKREPFIYNETVGEYHLQ